MSAALPPLRVYIIRHGETAWSLSGQHTGRSEIHLTARGEEQARDLRARLAAKSFAHVFRSPRHRALQTCTLAGLGGLAVIEPDLREWEYGEYEGLTSAQIHQQRPGWDIFRDGCPGGESPGEIAARADALAERWARMPGPIAAFSHGHFLRVFAMRWVGWDLAQGRHLALSTASIGILTRQNNVPDSAALALWNETSQLE